MTEPIAPQHASAKRRLKTPYVGLVPFGEQDAAFFFGRSQEKQVVIGNLRAARLTILYGPSGVGKTSLLWAGAVHDLREQVRRNAATERAPFAICAFSAWRDDPLSVLVEAVRAACTEALAGEELPRWSVGTPLVETLSAWTRRVRTLLIVLDQFEEYFLYHPDEHGEGSFAFEFPRVVNEPNLRVHFLLSIREDAWAKLDRFAGQIPRLFANYLRVEHLDREGAREAIERPLEQWNLTEAVPGEEVTIEPALVEALLAEVEAGKVLVDGAEARVGTVAESDQAHVESPYLQLVLTRLWAEEQAAGSRVLRLLTLERLGGAERIIRTHLDTTMDAFPQADQDVAARAFRYLVTPSGTKIAHSARDLAELSEVPSERLDPVLARLAGEARILRPVGETSYEIYHDALAGPILDWRARWLERQRHRRERRRVAMYGSVAVLLGLLAVAFLFLFVKARDAREAARSRALAATATAELQSDPQQSLSLAERAIEAAATEEAEDVLRASLAEANIRAVLHGHRGRVTTAAFSRDGRLVVTAGDDGTARIWDARTGRALHVLRGHEGRVWDAAFSPDGTRVVTAGDDATARVWSVAGGRTLQVLGGHGGAVLRAVFSPGGRLVLTTSADRTARVWDSRTGRSLHVLRDHTGPVTQGAFNPDGTLVVTAGDDGTARVWDVASGQSLHVLRGHTGAVLSAAFSPDGALVVTAGADGTGRIWDARAGSSLHAFRAHGGEVWGAALSPDGRRIVTANGDGKARIWDSRSGTLLHTLRGHDEAVESAVFSPDGRFVLTAGDDGTTRVWDGRGGKLLRTLRGHSGPVYGAGFGPDGRLIASGGGDGTTRVWDAQGRPLALLRSRSPVYAVAFSPDGRSIVTAGGGATAQVWDARRGRLLDRLRGTGVLYSASFSPDGRFVVTGGVDGTVSVWDARGKLLRTLRGHSGAVYSTSFSPDGKLVVTAGADRTVRIWDARTGVLLEVLSGNRGAVRSSAFSADGRFVATVTVDGTARSYSCEVCGPLEELRDRARQQLARAGPAAPNP